MPTYNGTPGADTFTAPDDQDWIINGVGGGDTLTGGGGNDTINGGKGSDTLNGGAGNDTFLVDKGAGADIINGGADYDIVKATGDDVIIVLKSFSGIEEFSADGHLNTTITGTGDDNVMDFSAITLTGIALISGAGGNDTIIGNGADNVVDGGPGNDIINVGAGNDTILFGKGSGFDTLVGGAGYDTAKATADSVRIGLTSFLGIEEFSADGHADVTISGGAGNDIFDFSNVKLTGISLIYGSGGDDTIFGSAGDDTIEGGAGNDNLLAGAGNDTFLVAKNEGLDGFDGGDGFDTIKAIEDGVNIGLLSLSRVEAISGDGHFNVKILGTAADDTMSFAKIALTDIFAIDGGDGNDNITGSVADDTILGGDGDDILNGGMGNDTLSGGKGHDILAGNDGDDSFYMSSGADVYKGGDGYDVIYAAQNGATLQVDKGLLSSIEEINANGFFGVTISAANTVDGSLIDMRHIVLSEGDLAEIRGGNGPDTIFGSFVGDVINGGNGDDMLSGYFGDDIMHGGGGADTLLGGAGFDELDGDVGNDILDGGGDDDVINGGLGDDTILITTNPGLDVIDGGEGYDTIKAGEGVTTIKFLSFANIEAISSNGTQLAQILGSFDNDSFDFTNVTLTGIKSIDGGEGNDTITGSVGNDTIFGNIGDDTLLGGIGDDILTGNEGADILTGGAGADLFEDKASDFNGDTITDFELGDTIHVTNVKNPAAVVLSYDNGVLTLSGPSSLGAGININLPGAFTTSSFELLSDGGQGVLIHLIA